MLEPIVKPLSALPKQSVRFLRRILKWRADVRAASRKLRFHPLPKDGRPLRVVHIGTDIYGGAGLGMVRLHEALLKAGVDSRILCTNARPEDDRGRIRNKTLFGWEKKRMRFPTWLRDHGLFTALFFRGRAAQKEIKERWGAQFSPPFTMHRIEWTGWVLDADIVHLHWVAGFLDVPSFFRHCRKPIVWTLRDEAPLLGGFHYSASVPPDLSPELKRFDERIRRIRKRAIRRHGRTAFVALSAEHGELAGRSPIARTAKVAVIPNPLSEAVMSAVPLSVAEARRKLGLPDGPTIVLFAAQHLRESRKGFDKAVEAVSRLRAGGRNVLLAAVGRPDQPFPLPDFSIAPGFLDSASLTDWYFAADVFINPSMAEGCCKTLLDAVGCGTPCVAFPHSGAREAIGDDAGVVTEDFTTDALEKGIEDVLRLPRDRMAIRRRALSEFSPAAIAERHVELYLGLLRGGKSSGTGDPVGHAPHAP